MKTYEIKLKGISPLIWNRMKRELEEEKKKLKKDQLSEWEQSNWIRKAELDGNGNAIIPPEWIRGALTDSCKMTRIVPHFATAKNQTYTKYINSCMVEVTKPAGKKKDLEEFGAYVGSQGSRGGGKVWRIRPMLREWNTSFILRDPEGRASKEEIKTIISHAGLMVGLGDNRINNYGRFEVTELQEVS